MTNTKRKANNKGPKLSKKRQEALFEAIKQDVSEEPLGNLLTQMNRLVKRAEHQAEVSAIVERFNKSTVDMPSNFVALAAVRVAWEAVTTCLFIAGVITEGRGKKEIKAAMDQYREEVESAHEEFEKQTGTRIPRKVGPKLVKVSASAKKNR
jgi:hypothetical protein